MGLLDKLFRRNTPENSSHLPFVQQNADLMKPTEIEAAITERAQKIQLSQCLKLSYGDLAVLGTSFAQMIPSLRSIAQSFEIGGVGYIPINNVADEALKQFRKDMPGVFAGSFKSATTGKATMAQWVELPAQALTSSAVIPPDPTMLIMAAMLASIEKKLDAIQEMQQSILSFLEEDKQAEQQANLRFLNDMLAGYKFNWNNDRYLQDSHVKALDIRQAADRNIEFYQKRIADAIKKIPTIYLDQVVKSTIANLDTLFAEYRMATYLFAYASFIELLMLGNFQEDYLSNVADRVKNSCEQYQTQFAQVRDMSRQLTGESIETRVLTGLGHASQALGKMIAASSVLGRGQVDEWLQENGEKLLRSNNERAEKNASMIQEDDKLDCAVFIDSIRNISLFSNQTTDILFDNETLYLACS